jgi:hypothetical protein
MIGRDDGRLAMKLHFELDEFGEPAREPVLPRRSAQPSPLQ